MAEIAEIKFVMEQLCDVLIAEKEELTEIDSRLGDGDMGISMEKGGLAVKEMLSGWQGENIAGLFSACAAAFNRAAPSTLGTLLSMGMLALAKESAGCTRLTAEQLIRFPGILAAAISKRGKANVGDKTILDALVPCAEAMEAEYAESKTVKRALDAAVKAAQEGMERTKGMLAKTGRASWLDGRNREYPDGGAVLCARLMERLKELAEEGTAA